MAWPYSGSWEGQPIPNLSYIIAAICVAINERNREICLLTGQPENDRDIDFTTATGTSAMPTAADFVGYRVDNPDVLGEIVGGIHGLNFTYSKWYTDDTFTVQVPLTDYDDWQAIIDDAGIDWEVSIYSDLIVLPSRIGQVDFWLACKAVLDSLVYLEYSNFLSDNSGEMLTTSTTNYPGGWVSLGVANSIAGVYLPLGGSVVRAVPTCSYEFDMPSTMQSAKTYKYRGGIASQGTPLENSSTMEFDVLGFTVSIDENTVLPYFTEWVEGGANDTVDGSCTDYESLENSGVPLYIIYGEAVLSVGSKVQLDMTTFLTDQA
jgi:hypothetical protein